MALYHKNEHSPCSMSYDTLMKPLWAPFGMLPNKYKRFRVCNNVHDSTNRPTARTHRASGSMKDKNRWSSLWCSVWQHCQLLWHNNRCSSCLVFADCTNDLLSLKGELNVLLRQISSRQISQKIWKLFKVGLLCINYHKTFHVKI